jgi:hypothetical protein
MWICKTSHNFAKTGNRCVSPQPAKFVRCISLQRLLLHNYSDNSEDQNYKTSLSLINNDRRVFPILYFFTNPSIYAPMWWCAPVCLPPPAGGGNERLLSMLEEVGIS